MDELITTDSILSWLTNQVKHKKPISPEQYLEAGTRLNLLKSDENDRLIEIEHELAVIRSNLVSQGSTSAAAKTHIEANPLYKEVQQLRAKLKRIDEAVKLAKLAARLKNDEMNNIRFT